MSETNLSSPDTNSNKTVKSATKRPYHIAGLIVFSVLLFSAQNLLAAPAKPTTSQQSAQTDSQSRKDDKAKDYGDINDEDSHATTRHTLVVADGDDGKATDYGDIDDDDGHASVRAVRIVA